MASCWSTLKNPLLVVLWCQRQSYLFFWRRILRLNVTTTIRCCNDSVDVIVAKKWTSTETWLNQCHELHEWYDSRFILACWFDWKTSMCSIRLMMRRMRYSMGRCWLQHQEHGTYQFSFEDIKMDTRLVAHVKAVELGSWSILSRSFRYWWTDLCFWAYDSSYFFGIQQFGDPLWFMDRCVHYYF